MSLTKAKLIESIGEQMGFQKKQSSEAVEAMIETIKNALASGEDVLISGFGKFCVNQKNARKGRNPATGEDLILPARRVVTFKCSAKLKERMNEVPK